jgi:2-polyprenyl-6-methoxyphenol hydroxylase-like FAD-dependent oxidoreductase
MATVVMTGGGVVGLITAMLLGQDGHEVTVLERDAAPPPSPLEAWSAWERRGVNQFRLGHFFMPRFREVVEQELPEVLKALEDAGGYRFNPLALAPSELTGGWRAGDERFEAITGRRPVFEAVIAACAERSPRVTVRRGDAAVGLTPGPSTSRDVPHAAGVRTDKGEELPADLVVDATGRRSPLPQWLTDMGAAPPHEELEDSGFFYYGRHFQSSDGQVPPALGPLAQSYGSVTILTLPCDNGTWAIVIVSSAKDKELRGLRDVDRWTSAVRSFPLVAHWTEGQPLENEIVTMSKIEDRYRRFAVDGRPVATGVVAVADSWSCTNPSLGRGVSIGTLHALALRDVVRQTDLGDPLSFSSAFDSATQDRVEPWYRMTLHYDRHRLAEIEAEIKGEHYDPADPEWELTQCLQHAGGRDPDCFRAGLAVNFVLSTPDEVLAQPGLVDKVMACGSDWRNAPSLGLNREQLTALVAG